MAGGSRKGKGCRSGRFPAMVEWLASDIFFWGKAEVHSVIRGQVNVVLEFVRAGSPAEEKS